MSTDASIGYQVPLIPQTTSMSCWAAGIAMIVGWRRGVIVDPVAIAANPGGVSYLAQFQSGLDPNDSTILRRWGLVTEAPRSYEPDAFGELLQRYGPLWVAASVPGPHVRVVTGYQPGVTAANAIVGVNDPWELGMNTFQWPNRGARYTRTYLQFTTEVETLARNELNQPTPVYVAHLP
jgi:hypothetical protein